MSKFTKALIQKHNPGVDTIECAHRPQYLQQFGSNERQPLSYLKGRRVVAFCGIATPESFEKFLRDLGAKIVGRERYLDHYRYGPEDFDELAELARYHDAECLITTEKDAVRIPDELKWSRPLYYLRLEIEILRGASDFDEAVGRICFPQNGSRPPLN